VSSADVLLGISTSVDVAETRQLEEALRRRMADKQLRDELAAHDFSGPQYRRFQEELARYGTSVLRAWMYSGYVFKLVTARGFAIHPTDAELEELHRDSEVRDELANMTVAVALPRFREHALIGAGWQYEGGAGLPTYFMGSCLYVFPNEFRRRRVQQERWRRQDGRDPATTRQEADHVVSDPAVIATGNIQVLDHLRGTDPRTRAIVALTIDGYSQEEIVELLGERSVRAVEGVLYRWRTQYKDRTQGGDQ
jgi:DNA-directed RNA polymerase specialized sigma24 family protein